MSKTFEIKSGKIVLSDPCYTLGLWCQGLVENVKNGVWMAKVDHYAENINSFRISSLTIYNVEEAIKNHLIKDCKILGSPLPYICGVDSGQFGFFDADVYRNDNLASGLPKVDFISKKEEKEDGDIFYAACCYLTLNEENGEDIWGILPNGVVSSSGFGDGSYACVAMTNDKDEYVAFAINFIEDSDMDDLDDLDDLDETLDDE